MLDLTILEKKHVVNMYHNELDKLILSVVVRSFVLENHSFVMHACMTKYSSTVPVKRLCT